MRNGKEDLSRYSWFNPGYLFYIQQLERRVLALLRAEGLYALHELIKSNS